MTRFVAVGLVLASIAAGSGVARADTGTLPGGGTVTWSKFAIYDSDTNAYVEPSDPEVHRRYLNLAHCQCAKLDAGKETKIQYELGLSGASTGGNVGDFWVGTSCNTTTERNDNCRKLDYVDVSNLDELVTPKKRELNLYDLINGKDDTGECDQREGTATAWLMADTDGNSDYDYISTQAVGKLNTVEGIDTKPPRALSNVSASGSEGAIEISFELPEASSGEYAYFQALCATAEDDAPVFSGEAVPSPRYQTAATLCAATTVFDLPRTALTIAGEDQVTTAPAGFADLDSAFVCSDLVATAATSLRIEGLTNGTKYKVAILAIDDYGNAVGTYLGSTITPKPVIDFWEDLNGRDSAIDGGCLLSKTYGESGPLTTALRAFRDDTLARTALGRALIDAYYGSLGKLAVESLPARIAAGIALAPLAAIALGWHYLTLPGLLGIALLALLGYRARRRVAQGLARGRLPRRAHRLAVAGAVAAVLAPSLAAADDFAPYWEDPSTSEPDLGVAGKVRWIAGIRVGPYIPDIDLQFPQNATTGLGPYAAMFGDWFLKDGVRHNAHVYQVLPMLDVDRVVWDGFGQLGVGGSIGYMQKTAHAYAVDPMDPTDSAEERQRYTESSLTRIRSSATTSFHLLPLAATVSYRFTYLDDRWGIPIVPYLRGGLAYYAWWMKAPNGDLSKTCDGMVTGDMCTDEDKAYGGTAGVQASAGIAIRAERLDSAAARSMRTSGLQHAGFYAEVFWGRVDGFGSDTKLWVGDTTWFAGANFEF